MFVTKVTEVLPGSQRYTMLLVSALAVLMIQSGCASHVSDTAPTPADEHAVVMVDNETTHEIEVYGMVANSPVLFGIASSTLPSRITIPPGLNGSRIEILLHPVGTDDWFRSASVRVESNTDYAVRVSTDQSSGRVLVAGGPAH